MAIQSLRDLYIDELRDLYSAEDQILEALPAMASAASSDALKRAFNEHLEQTRVQRERLDLIFKQLDERASGKRCEGMAGLLKEGRERLTETMPSDVKDAALIAAAQRVEHYEMAGYGTARTHAGLLGDWESERLLQQTLDEEGDTDHLLTRIAQGGINQGAARDDDSLYNQRWSRLRFLDVDDLDRRPVDYTSIGVRGSGNEDLGMLDGFIVEGASGRPFYYVVDSGGWFMGRRYLVPIGQGRLNAADRSLQLALDKPRLQRLPEFNPSAFMAMSDDQLRNYERRTLRAISPEAGSGARYWESYDRLPEYKQPEWVTSGAWTYGERRGVEPARPDRTAPETPVSTTPAGRTADFENADLVTARAEDERARDPRLNTLGEGVRGVSEGEPGPRTMDEEERGRR